MYWFTGRCLVVLLFSLMVSFQPATASNDDFSKTAHGHEQLSLWAILYGFLDDILLTPLSQWGFFAATELDDVLEDVAVIGGTFVITCTGYVLILLDSGRVSKKQIVVLAVFSHAYMTEYADDLSNVIDKEAPGPEDRYLITRLVSDLVEDSVKTVWYVWKLKWTLLELYLGVSRGLVEAYLIPEQRLYDRMQFWGRLGVTLYIHVGTLTSFVQDYTWINTRSDQLGDAVSRCLLIMK